MSLNEENPPPYETVLSRKTVETKTADKHNLNTTPTASTTILPSIPSLASTLMLSPSSSNHEPTVHPGRYLRIDARGIDILLPLHLPSSQLKIPIHDAADGSLAYVSSRHRSCSGDAILSHPLRGDVVETTYFFGPSRDPVVTVLQGQPESELTRGTDKESCSDASTALTIQLATKWTSRAMSFTIPGPGKDSDSALEWSYAKRKNPTTGEKINLILLRYIPTTGNGDRDKNKHTDSSSKILAQLIRSNGTRYPGSSRCSAGNGGVLVIDRDTGRYIDECLVVATCLVMLKREIDRGA